jgi:hypothetical protein
MSKGRHSAGYAPAHRRTNTGFHKVAPGARKAPPQARKASPQRVGGAKVEGRRVADGDGRPVVLTALGSGEKLLALLPLAALSAAWVAGLAATGDGDPAASPSSADPGTTTGQVGQQTEPRSVPAPATPTSARPAISETTAPVVTDEDTGPAVDQEPAPVDESTPADSPAEPPAAPPPSQPRQEDTTPPAPNASPTPTPDTTDESGLTKLQATTQCLASGISALDLVGLGECVDELLS